MTEKVKKTRAPGAGVKADDGALTERKQLRLDADTEALFLRVGDGNVSLGARETARRLVEHKDTEKFSSKRHELRQPKP